MSLSVRTISTADHLAFLTSLPSASFLQTPAWAAVKSEWRGESIGWFDGGDIVGAGLVLYRKLPKVAKYLAYLPEGPSIDFASAAAGPGGLAAWLDPMVKHLTGRGAFGVRMGPPVVLRRWDAATVKKAVADPALRTLGDAPAAATDPRAIAVTSELHRLGWREQVGEGGFTAGQPKYNFWLPLVDADGAPRSEEAVLRGMNQLWRRNIKKADKAGVEVTLGGADDIAAFHTIYAETAERDHFTPRPLAYFQTMWDALNAEDPDRMRLYLARHEGDLVAATTMVRVGQHAWYSYGASTTAKREVRGSNAIQWRMIRDALAAGCTVYDMRGITDTLDPEDSHVGLIQFKVGTGGEAVEYAGEWDLPINRLLYLAFQQYMKRR
ncbi:aminoacyltransferase [Mumia sp. zg.B53]|uniref:lipid II:glycine glycyltransferase FemX n=1 Tax=unclassified Mumia TaxID=2621872 RepID=UPI001C6E773A|nr:MULTISPECIES: peptidoglycan bridge formation glycyltransferase FemA/FemB family protein [unclassified Mumia]MBW9209910.1 aminoacyltransferase [Mumia sp. zg.B21]MBW9214514.1 aminoacyltransferase [Mumia sp. zg.B53]MDD9348164.1 peptidoglycan bridge formation glycyltransferase FemA/FemB family protein [Mumia sp.]